MNAHVGRLGDGNKVLRVNGASFLADPSGVLFWPDERLMVVADLHLEKGSSYAARRVFLPPYDTGATLLRLAAAVARLDPRRVVALGDSFHDGGAAARLRADDVAALRAMQAGRDWLWIAGNHDPAAPAALEGDHAAEFAVGAVRFRHVPAHVPAHAPAAAARAGRLAGEIAGHLHPVAIVGGRGGMVRRRCFVSDGVRCVMPAFGAYAGGLNFLDAAVSGLFGADEHFAHVLGRDAVYTVARRQCLADSRSPEVRPVRR